MSATAATPGDSVAVSLEGSLAVAFVLLFEIPILTGARFWVMRHNTRTPSRTVSDCFFIFFSLLILACAVPLMTNMFHEKYRGPAAFTENYMKVCFVEFKCFPGTNCVEERLRHRSTLYIGDVVDQSRLLGSLFRSQITLNKEHAQVTLHHCWLVGSNLPGKFSFPDALLSTILYFLV